MSNSKHLQKEEKLNYSITNQDYGLIFKNQTIFSRIFSFDVSSTDSFHILSGNWEIKGQVLLCEFLEMPYGLFILWCLYSDQ